MELVRPDEVGSKITQVKRDRLPPATNLALPEDIDEIERREGHGNGGFGDHSGDHSGDAPKGT